METDICFSGIIANSVSLFLSDSSWQMKKPLPSPRCHASVCEVADTLYLVGGSVVGQGTQPVTSLPDVLQYWEEKDVWVQWGFLNIPRHDAACCSIGKAFDNSLLSIFGPGIHSRSSATILEMALWCW